MRDYAAYMAELFESDNTALSEVMSRYQCGGADEHDVKLAPGMTSSVRALTPEANGFPRLAQREQKLFVDCF